MNFFWLIFAHFLGDTSLQGDWQAANKRKHWWIMLSHCVVWSGCICIALVYLELFAYWKVSFLIIGHWIADQWKGPRLGFPTKPLFGYIDQGWHMVQCLVVYIL